MHTARAAHKVVKPLIMAADGFVSRASLGDVDEVIRRLERKQDVNGKHSVRNIVYAIPSTAKVALC
jgi:hypothetical protein